MKIVAFVGETFEYYDGYCYTKPTSAAFLQDLVGKDNVYVCSPMKEVSEQPTTFSTKVAHSHFYPSPAYKSTKDFTLKSITKAGYLKAFQQSADKVIAEHPGAYFWIRTPSMGSIVFGLQALKAGEKVIHHMCADASNTWRGKKYKGIEKLLGFLLSRLIRWQLRKICKHENTINLCTGDVLEDFSRTYSPSNTHQFVDVMVKQPELINAPSPSNQERLNLLFVGRIVEDKGVFDLLEVVYRLKGKVAATIVGGGPELESAQRMSSKLGLENQVRFMGQLKHSELSKLYDASDVVVVPSNNHYEGFPRVIMEGWSHHKPVIVSNVGGVKAFVKDGENGLIFTPGSRDELYSKLENLLSDDALLNKLTSGAKSMSEISLQNYWLQQLNSILEVR
ncbi:MULTISPECIES: glycosyltransferase family 4 protein [Pseudoalteromonas]|uniref:glycosyltransferase family 4 protein n=1 Tax=Pseudoalteromonas TaxID=53246 RepID=UPI000F77ADED|nr:MULTISPECIES: glycosyltransferase family 4 protein [Pseudoalteromonas]